jgi:hypothetical protein
VQRVDVELVYLGTKSGGEPLGLLAIRVAGRRQAQ